jgi:hypothetical protein
MKLVRLLERFAAVLSERGVHVKPVGATPWLDGFLRQLPARLPRSYEHLVTHYQFPVLSVCGVDFYSNLGTNVDSELVIAANADSALCSACYSSSLVPVGRPEDGSYDPVCFDLRAGAPEAPLVRVDHEELLLNRRARATSLVSPSFLQLVRDVVAG